MGLCDRRVRRQHAQFFFFFNDTATTEIYTLSLHDALPIYTSATLAMATATTGSWNISGGAITGGTITSTGDRKSTRLNSSHLVISYAVFCLKKQTSVFLMSVFSHFYSRSLRCSSRSHGTSH